MAKVIMVQGTMSNVGKSLITAGLCRVFKEDGYRVAPFKSQNMALNSYITRDGYEIGRAQAVQAQACGIEPSVYMNPILLKPTTDVGSQVIVNGRPIGNMPAREYFEYKKKLIPDIMAAYDRLSSENDIIVVEGAGSPAEINLKSNDIVNMGLAEMLDAPVLLAGDIDRGGVFAQLFGTVKLLEKKEQERIKGILINKFRGDRTILEPGITMLQEKCGIPVIGVIPYKKLDIEEEDSLSERFTKGQCVNDRHAQLGIAVVKLPRMSNYTDFAPLEALPEVELLYFSEPHQMLDASPDMVIIPGTKNTISDMKWLRESGMEGAILKLKASGRLIMGICGGYQILGQEITDESGCEGNGKIKGIGLLNIDTVFSNNKYTKQSEGIYTYAGGSMCLSGYEIHMGQCVYKEGAVPFIIKTDKTPDGCIGENVIGTYFHGIFENDEFRTLILDELCQKKGIAGKTSPDYGEYKKMQFDELARLIRENVDMEAIYDILQKAE